MRIFIIGLGQLGRQIAELAAAGGHQIYGLRRSPAPPGPAPADRIQRLQGDVTDPGSLTFPAAIDRVIYCVSATDPTDEGYRLAYREGVSNVLGALAGASPSARLTFISSTSVYGENRGGWVDENSPEEPSGFRGRRMLEAEAEVHRSPIATTVCRLSGIYGPGRTRLVDSVRDGRSTYREGCNEWTNRIHSADAARAIVHVAELDDPPETLCVTDTRPATRREVLRWIAERGGYPAPRASESADSPPSPATGKRIRADRLLGLGFQHRYPSFEDGYATVV